jgi:hypothetical protein
MRFPAVNLVWAVVTGLPALLPIVIVLRYGLWPKRRGHTPYCRQCGYNLTGRVSDRCPECGSALGDKAIVYGERRRRPVVIALCLACFIALLAGRFWGVWPVDRYALCPAWLLIVDAASSNISAADRACMELRWRIVTGQLTPPNLSRLMDVALRTQAQEGYRLGSRRSFYLLTLLGEGHLAGRLSEAQRTTFLNQLPNGELRVRPRVIKGDRVPLSVWIEGRLPPTWWLAGGDVCPILVDGKPCGEPLKCPPVVGTGSGSATSFPCTQPGRHTVAVSIPVTCFAGGYGDPKTAQLIHKGRVLLEGTYEVLAEEPPDYIRRVADRSLGEQIQQAITPFDFAYGREPPYGHYTGDVSETLTGTIRLGTPPIGIVFKVVARIDGREATLCYFHKGEGQSHPQTLAVDAVVEGLSSRTIDIVFRAQPSAARHTVDLFEVWDGELVYKDVPVKDVRATVGQQGTSTKPDPDGAE